MNNILNDYEYNKYLQLGGNKNEYIQLSKKYYETLILYPELKLFSDNINVIREELINFKGNWNKWGKIVNFHEKSDWEVIPIYGFNKFTKISDNFPKLKELLLKTNNIDLLSFSKLGKNTILKPHQGWGSTANISIRSHLGIIVPENCGLWVEGEKKEIKNNEWISFDDSKFHSAYNLSETERIILMIDIKKPCFIKTGNSLVTESFEMIKYIEKS
jgi:beta-hydroxylase